MRKVSPSVDFLLNQAEVKTFFLVRIQNRIIDAKVTNQPFDLNIPAIGNFLSSTPLVEFVTPIIEDATNRESYKLSFTGTAEELSALSEQIEVGTLVTVYMGFYNITDNVVNGVAPGEPLTSLEDLVVAFSGPVDSKEYAADAVEQSRLFTIECSGPMAMLSARKAFITTKNQLQSIDPTDTAFDQVYKDSGSLTLLWGKE